MVCAVPITEFPPPSSGESTRKDLIDQYKASLISTTDDQSEETRTNQRDVLITELETPLKPRSGDVQNLNLEINSIQWFPAVPLQQAKPKPWI
ncbi:unnamed protein product [Caretta caretta]